MRSVGQLIAERKDLTPFKSVLSKDWQSVLFLAIHKLHYINVEGHADTKEIRNLLLATINEVDEAKLNQGIEMVQGLADNTSSVGLRRMYGDVLELLFAVKRSEQPA